MRCADAQRAEPQPPQPFARKRAVEPERSRLRAVAAARDENRGRRRRKPAKREREHGRRRRIEPLHVVDRDQQRPTAALPEQLEHRERDRPLVRRRPLDLLQQQRRRQRPTLRQRQPLEPLRQHRASTDRRAPRTRTPSRHPPDGKRRPRSPAPAPPPPPRRTASSSRSLPRRPARVPRACPARPRESPPARQPRPHGRSPARALSPTLPPRDPRRKLRRPSGQDRRASALLDAKAPLARVMPTPWTNHLLPDRSTTLRPQRARRDKRPRSPRRPARRGVSFGAGKRL